MIIIKFRLRSLKLLFTKRKSCKYGKPKFMIFKQTTHTYMHRIPIKIIEFMILYKWKCGLKSGVNKPFCELIGEKQCLIK